MSTNHIDQLLEAIKDGTLTIRHKDGAQWQLDANDKQMICSCLEKQIPKRPEVFVGVTIVMYCPTCGGSSIFIPEQDGNQHCTKCGQKYDWEE